MPDYSFLPYPFATSNPGGRGAAVGAPDRRENFLVGPDSHDPAFFDEDVWRLKRNGNVSNDFGDSNTVISTTRTGAARSSARTRSARSGFVDDVRALRDAG